MLGMMQGKGGGSTNIPGNPMNSGQMAAPSAAPMPQGKGGGSANMPVGGSPNLASLFMGNQPTSPQTVNPMPVNPILQPKAPVIPMPTTHPVTSPVAAPAPAPQLPPANSIGMAIGQHRLGQISDDMLNQFRRSFNYSNRNGGHGGSR